LKTLCEIISVGRIYRVSTR